MNTASPESVGFSSRKLSCLTPLLNAYVDQGKIPGIVFMVARRGKIAYAEAYGEVEPTPDCLPGDRGLISALRP